MALDIWAKIKTALSGSEETESTASRASVGSAAENPKDITGYSSAPTEENSKLISRPMLDAKIAESLYEKQRNQAEFSRLLREIVQTEEVAFETKNLYEAAMARKTIQKNAPILNGLVNKDKHRAKMCYEQRSSYQQILSEEVMELLQTRPEFYLFQDEYEFALRFPSHLLSALGIYLYLTKYKNYLSGLGERYEELTSEGGSDSQQATFEEELKIFARSRDLDEIDQEITKLLSDDTKKLILYWSAATTPFSSFVLLDVFFSPGSRREDLSPESIKLFDERLKESHERLAGIIGYIVSVIEERGDSYGELEAGSPNPFSQEVYEDKVIEKFKSLGWGVDLSRYVDEPYSEIVVHKDGIYGYIHCETGTGPMDASAIDYVEGMQAAYDYDETFSVIVSRQKLDLKSRMWASKTGIILIDDSEIEELCMEILKSMNQFSSN